MMCSSHSKHKCTYQAPSTVTRVLKPAPVASVHTSALARSTRNPWQPENPLLTMPTLYVNQSHNAHLSATPVDFSESEQANVRDEPMPQVLFRFFHPPLVFHSSSFQPPPQPTTPSVLGVRKASPLPSAATTTIVKKKKTETGTRGRVKASQFDSLTKTILEDACGFYRCLIVTEFPYPNRTEDQEWAEKPG
jgi:hypothetical protein